MAQTEIMQEYLIKLGYSVDKLQKSAFENAAGSAGEAVSRATSSMIKGFGAVVGLTGVAANSMANLYWQAKRAGSDPLLFKAWTDAFSQVGGQASEMSALLQNIGDTLNTTAGGDFMARILGARPKDAIDALDKILTKFEALRKANPNADQALLFQGMLGPLGGMLGVNPGMLNTLLRNQPEYREAIARQTAQQNAIGLTGADIKAGAVAVANFHSALDGLTTGLMKTMTPAIETFGGALNKALQSVIDNPQQVQAGIQKAGEFFSAMGQIALGIASLVRYVKPAVKWLEDHGLLHAATAAVGGLAVGGLPGALVAGAGTLVYDALRPDDIAAPVPAPPSEAASSTAKGDPRALMAMAMQGLGLTKTQAAAVLGRLQFESGLDPTASVIDSNGLRSTGLAQWQGSRAVDIMGFLGKDIDRASATEQMSALIQEFKTPQFAKVLSELRASSSLESALTAYEKFERPKRINGVAMGHDTALNVARAAQNIEINVTVNAGSGDPHVIGAAAANAVKNAMPQSITRNALQTNAPR